MAVNIQVELMEETCISCGIIFAIPADFQRKLREEHRTFYCPNGHEMYYPSETMEEKLRKKLLVAQRDCEFLRRSNAKLDERLNGALSDLHKAKRRANAGMCPHCKRHFANVRRHIETKHPDKL